MEVLCQIQGVIQTVAILQLHHSLPFIQPLGSSLPLFRPDIAEVDGVTDEFRCGAVLREDVLQLREAAAHIHSNALAQRLHLQCVQRQEKLVRVCGIHILAGVRESHPHAVRIEAACQPDSDTVVAFVGIQRRGAIQKRIDQGGDPDEVPVAEGVPTFLAVSCPHFLRVKKCTCLGGRALDLFHDKFAKSGIVPGAVEQVVVIQLTGNQHHIAGHPRLLDLHGPSEQETFFDRHVLEPPLQPVVLGLGHFKAVQEIKEPPGLPICHHIISIPAFSACISSLRIGSPSLRWTSP